MLTENLKKIKAKVHLITHTVNETPIIIIIILYYAMRQQSSNKQNDTTQTIIVISLLLFRSKIVSQWCLCVTAMSMNNERLDRHQPFLSCIARQRRVQETSRSVNHSHDVACQRDSWCGMCYVGWLVVFTAGCGYHHLHQCQSLTCSKLNGPTSPGAAAIVLVPQMSRC